MARARVSELYTTMEEAHDLALLMRSRTPVVVIETQDEARTLELLRSIAIGGNGGAHVPLFSWTMTDGLRRLDIELGPQSLNADPTDVLRHIRSVDKPGIYVLLDFHPFLQDPLHVRLLKDICIRYGEVRRQIVLISHRVDVPAELRNFCARFDLRLPSEEERVGIIRRAIAAYGHQFPGETVRVDEKAHELLVRNLAGLAHGDTERLARNAVFVDGAIASSDIPEVMQAKYELLNRDGTVQFEYDTARFADVGGLARLKSWLNQRRAAFAGDDGTAHLDAPRGILLTGVQGCGKSLAAKATAGLFGVPLLRLDLGAVYDKYHGESERKLREALRTADVMAPCVLWLDEIEKGLAGRGGESGTTQRVLGTFLTWMSERSSRVFIVATSNDIESLPAELVRKGRFDELFFVDLPGAGVRAEILSIHLAKRGLEPQAFDTERLAAAAAGFSGAELEQAIVAALYAAHAKRQPLSTDHIAREFRATRPLSVLMRERIAGLRRWAKGRTVYSD